MKNLHLLVFVLIACHYPITTVWFLQLGIATSSANLAIKASISFIAVVAIFTAGSLAKWSPKVIPLLIFFILYGIRLIYDVIILEIPQIVYRPIYVLGYFFGLTLIPALAISVCARETDVKKLHHLMFLALIAANLSLLYYVSTTGLAIEAAFSGRFEVEGEVQGTAIINPILVGIMGAMLAAFAMGRLAVMRFLGIVQHLIHLGLVTLGVVNILLSGSRGPALAFAVALLILFYTLTHGLIGQSRLKPRAILWIYGGVGVAALVYVVSAEVLDIYLFDRFALMFEERASGGSEERDFIYWRAWNDFLEHPIVGSSYVVSVGGWLAHNFILDALMSTGLVGGGVFFIALFWASRGTIRMLQGKAGMYGYPLALAGVCLLVVGATSGSVGQTPELWVFIVFMTIHGNRPEPVRTAPEREASLAAA